MVFSNITQDGKVSTFPAWGQYLAKLGRYMSRDDEQDVSERPAIAVACLPRIDYASLFIAYGSLGALSMREACNPTQQNHNIDHLLEKTVSYLKIRANGHSIILGSLKSIDNMAGVAELVTKTNRTSHDRYLVSRKDWHWIREADIAVDITRGATNLQRLRAGEGYQDYHKIAEVVGHPMADAATRISEAYLTVIGEKARFTEEVASIEFSYRDTSIPAGLLLNSEKTSGNFFRCSGRYIELLASGRALSEAHASVVVIEAGRRLGDQITQIGKNKRAIILLAANKRSHNDVVELLAPLINFRGLHRTAPELGEAPHYLRTIFIR